MLSGTCTIHFIWGWTLPLYVVRFWDGGRDKKFGDNANLLLNLSGLWQGPELLMQSFPSICLEHLNGTEKETTWWQMQLIAKECTVYYQILIAVLLLQSPISTSYQFSHSVGHEKYNALIFTYFCDSAVFYWQS